MADYVVLGLSPQCQLFTSGAFSGQSGTSTGGDYTPGEYCALA
jgi:hypothetical protein